VGLTLLKPHLVLVLWVPLGLECLRQRRWRVLLGAAGTALTLTGLAWACNPQVMHQFVQMWRQDPPASWVPPTPGSLLRLLLGPEKFWLVLVFPALGVAWAVAHWWRRRDSWDWPCQLPVVLLVGFLTAAYGWAYDLVVLLPALLQVAAGLVRSRPAVAVPVLAGYFLLTALATFMNLAHWQEHRFFWIAPAVLVGYLLLRPPAVKPAVGAG
jgi:hypothetical protein